MCWSFVSLGKVMNILLLIKDLICLTIRLLFSSLFSFFHFLLIDDGGAIKWKFVKFVAEVLKMMMMMISRNVQFNSLGPSSFFSSSPSLLRDIFSIVYSERAQNPRLSLGSTLFLLLGCALLSRCFCFSIAGASEMRLNKIDIGSASIFYKGTILISNRPNYTSFKVDIKFDFLSVCQFGVIISMFA